jgi:hypothetical protein
MEFDFVDAPAAAVKIAQLRRIGVGESRPLHHFGRAQPSAERLQFARPSLLRARHRPVCQVTRTVAVDEVD